MSEKPFIIKLLTIGVVLFAAAGCYMIFSKMVIKPVLTEGLIQANGRIEGETYVVATKIAGKITKILAQEGDSVKSGQILAQLDDSQIREKVSQAAFALEAAAARLKAAETAYGLMKKEVPIAIERAKAGRAHSQAILSKSTAAKTQSLKDADRFRRLAEEGAVGRQKSEQMDLALESAKSDLESAQSGLIQAEKQLEEANLGQSRLKAKEDELKAVEAQVDQASAALSEVESILSDLTVRAPADGVITTKTVNPGEVVAPGSPLFSMVNLDQLFLKVYVPEKEIGKLKLNLSARIYIDAMPDTPFEGTITFIASKAEFTPKEVQTPDERVKLVYAVKISLSDNPEHRLTPGLPADAVIRWKEGIEWAKPVW
jgi:HlyD family secretion protein